MATRLRFAVLATVLFALSAAPVRATGMLDACHGPFTEVYKRFIHREIHGTGNDAYQAQSVDYRAIGKYQGWTAYLDRITSADGARVRSATGNNAKAFWINTYNALLLDEVVKRYALPRKLASVQDIPRIWTKRRIVALRPGSLTHIEDTLKRMDDPRVGLALITASRGSPLLMEQPYESGAIDTQLDRACYAFLLIPGNFRIDSAANTLHLSGIFTERLEWFQLGTPVRLPGLRGYYSDADQAVLSFVIPRVPPEKRAYVLGRHPTIVYDEFDWSLNDLKQ